MGFKSLLCIFRVPFSFWRWCNQAATFAGNTRHPGPSCCAPCTKYSRVAASGSLPSRPFPLQVYPYNCRHRPLDPRKEGYYLTSEAFLVLPVALSCEFCSDLTSTDSRKTGKLFHLFFMWVLSNHQMNRYSQPFWVTSVQFSLVTQLCLTLYDLMGCSTPGLPVHHQLPEFTQTHVHWIGDAIQPSHPHRPLLCLPSIFPSIRVFSDESALCIR